MAGTIDKLKAKVDNVLHKDKTHDPAHSTHTGTGVGNTTHTGTHGTTGTTGTHGTTGGLGTTHGSDPTGPHDSHLANKADPRVDSDRYGTAGNTTGAGGVGTGQYGSSTTHGTTGGLTGGTHTGTTGSGLTGSHNTHGTTGSGLTGSHNTHGTTGSGLTGSNTGYGSNTHGATHGSDPSGPHDSKLANKLDPTVDTKSYGTVQGGHPKYDSNTTSTGYGSNTHGTTGGLTGGTHNTHGTTGGLTGGLTGGAHNTHGTTGGQTGGLTGGTHNTHGTTGYSDPTGPHDSHLANKADPRVDSDRYGAAGNTTGAGGYGTGQYGSNTHGTTGGLGSSTTHHDGEALPKALTEDVSRADHRSGGLTGTHGQHGAANVGSGNSNKTAGPHNSDLLNKIDPRVDSDLDGSKTVGGNQTYH